MSDSTPGPFQFGSFELNPASRELRKHGLRVKLTPHEMSLLCLLVEPPLKVRTREEIQRQLWPTNTFVDFEHGMNKVVHRLRETLGDSATNPRFIETVNATGYRFIPQSLKFRHVGKRDSLHSLESLAVLPITTTGPEDMVDRCHRITFHLVAGLSAFQHRVVAQATLKSYKVDGAVPQQAGEILGVDAVISGELMRSDGVLFFKAELIDVSDGTQLCGAHAETADSPGSQCDVQLAREVLDHFRPLLVPIGDRCEPQLKSSDVRVDNVVQMTGT